MIAVLHPGPMPAYQTMPLLGAALPGIQAADLVACLLRCFLRALLCPLAAHHDHTSGVRKVQSHPIRRKDVQRPLLHPPVPDVVYGKKGVPGVAFIVWARSSRWGWLAFT